MSDENLKLVVTTARVYNLLFSKIEKNIQGFGLNISEFGVLEMLLSRGEQPIQKIAEKVLVTSGTITYVIDKLQKKELVYRMNCQKDKRVFYIYLTEKGKELISDIFPKHKLFLEELFIGLNLEFKNQITKDIVTFLDILNEK